MSSKSIVRFLVPFAACLLIAGALLPHGCARETKTAREVKEEFALKLLQGESIGFVFVQAGSADPESLDLYDLRIEHGDRILHADHASIVIDEAQETISLRLHGLVGADPESGLMVSLEALRTGEADLPYRIARSKGD